MLSPDEFEAGEDVTDQFEVTPRDKRGIVISFRVNLDEAAGIIAKAEAEHLSLAAYARRCALREVAEATVWVRYEPGMTITMTHG